MTSTAPAERQRLSELITPPAEPQALAIAPAPTLVQPVTLADEPAPSKVVVFENVVEHSVEIDQFIGALAKAQGRFGPIERTLTATVDSKRTNSTYTYDYAPLDVVFEAVRPALSEAGIAYMQFPSARPNSVTVVTFLAHQSGQWFRSRLTVGGPEHGDPQAVKSACTYAKRIAFESIIGISPAHDDDGDAADRAVRSTVRPGKGPVQMPQRDLAGSAARTAEPSTHAGTPAPLPATGPQTSAGFTVTAIEKRARTNKPGFFWPVKFSNGVIASTFNARMGEALEKAFKEGTRYADVLTTKQGSYIYIDELVPMPSESSW